MKYIWIHTHIHMLTLIHRYVWMYLFCCWSVAKLCLTLRDPMDCSMPGFPVLHYPSEFAQIHVRWVSDAIQPSHPQPLSSFAFSLSQHQGLFQRIGSSHHVARVLEFQLHHQHIPKSIYLSIYLSIPLYVKCMVVERFWLSVFCVYVSFILFLEHS